MFKKKKKAGIRDDTQEKKVAIDVGIHSIKFAYFKENLLFLDEFPLFEQPKDITGLKKQELLDRQSSTINKAISMINPKAEFVLSPQPSLQILTRMLHNPPDTDIRRYLDKELPFDPDQFSFDTHEVRAASKDKKLKISDKKSSRLAVAVTDLDFIQRSIGLLGEYQLQVKRFTPGSVALLNYISLSSDGNDNQPVVLLDLGALFTNLIIYRGMGKFLARTIELGGNHLNRELAEKLNVDFETAEKIKTERKLIDDSLFDSKGVSTSMPMFQAVNSVLFGLVDEIKNSMTYFEDSFMEDLSDAVIWLAGGASNLQNLDRFLTREIELPVKKAEDPVHSLAPDNQFAPQFASVIGLLGKPSHAGLLEINLMKNIEGLLFKLEGGDYYLTGEGFVDKKGYKRKQKVTPLKPSVIGRPTLDVEEEPIFMPIALLKSIPEMIRSLIKGERIQMPKTRGSFSQMDFSPIKAQLKNIFVVIGALFLAIFIGNRFYWAPKMKGLDRTINAYISKRAELDRLKGSLMSDTEDTDDILLVAKVTRTDKIIWSNILKAISAAVPERVWISDLKINGKNLILSCHVYSYGEDHLNDIALFMENIKTREEFLKDFEDVKFHSALRNKQDQEICDFTLTFPLKRDIIEEVTETIEKITG